MTATTDTYLALLPSEHANKPNFTAALKALTQGLVDIINTEVLVMTGYDLDVAIGVQLDAIGKWIGVTRSVAIPITGVYFAFDTATVGWDQGTWQGAYDPSTGLTNLPDDAYRTLLRAKIGINHWDGTMPSLIAIMSQVFIGTGTTVFGYDHQDMTMDIVISGVAPSALNLALLTRGVLNPKPAGVKVNYITSSTGGSPIFGFDIENVYISGFDVGSWSV
jgi:hypothetical protein